MNLHATTSMRDEMLETGLTRLTLTDEEAELLQAALTASRAFFAQDLERKQRYSSGDTNHGYRPLGLEYSISPDRPDMNDCFTLWSNRLDLIPNSTEISELTGALLAWRAVLATKVQTLIRELAAHFGVSGDLPFENASYLQLNSYVVTPMDREFLQERHEDGHMVTVLHATSPGLEAYLNDQATPVVTSPREVIIMAGSVLTDLSGGAIPPLYHQVRNLGLAGRQALMYFVNPSLDEPVLTWDERRLDVRDAIRTNPGMFGLPLVPQL